MAFSYSGLKTYGKVSLPSVESWGTNNNILKDPPRSITTRRIDKVSENSFFTQELQDSSDRIAEAISAYPRGINPMVGVSYGNSNAGNLSGQALLYRGQQAKLPYRVMNAGAFRPPVLTPVDLLPLSRMPRNTTKINPIIFSPDFSKKITCSEEKRALTTRRPKVRDMTTSMYFKIEKPAEGATSHATKELSTYSVTGNVKYLTGKDQRSKYTVANIKEPLNKNVTSARGSTEQKFVRGTQQLKDRPTLDISWRASETGIKSKFIRPVTSARVKQGVHAACFSNESGIRKYAMEPTYIEKKDRPELRVSARSSAFLGHAGGVNIHPVNSKVSLHRPGAIVLDRVNSGPLPTMNRVQLQPRLRVKN
jgi:hypothetical protein